MVMDPQVRNVITNMTVQANVGASEEVIAKLVSESRLRELKGSGIFISAKKILTP